MKKLESIESNFLASWTPEDIDPDTLNWKTSSWTVAAFHPESLYPEKYWWPKRHTVMKNRLEFMEVLTTRCFILEV